MSGPGRLAIAGQDTPGRTPRPQVVIIGAGFAVHIGQLIRFRNRLLVLTGWAWSYIAWHRGVRLITRRWTASPHVLQGEVPGSQRSSRPAA